MFRYHISKDDRVMLMLAVPQTGRNRGLLKSRCKACIAIKNKALQDLVGWMWKVFGLWGRK